DADISLCKRRSRNIRIENERTAIHSHVGVQLVKAQTVIGSGGSLTLRDLQGDEVEADKTLHIAQNGTVVAEGD
ncbi:hypothetical protein ACUOFC_54815, partial [Escherichia sp. TWPC-MK]